MVVEMSDSAAKMNETILNAVEDGPKSNMSPIPVMYVDDRTFVRVVEYCEHVTAVPAGMPDMAWMTDFMGMGVDALFDLFKAANYLNNAKLLDDTLNQIVCEIRGITPAQIRQKFGIVDDLSPGEVAEICAGNGWAVLTPDKRMVE